MAYKLGMKPQPSQVTVDLNQNPKDWERRSVVEKSVTHIWGKSKATIEGCGLSGTQGFTSLSIAVLYVHGHLEIQL